MSGEFDLLSSDAEISGLSLALSESLEPSRNAVVVNGSREFEFSFEVELDPRHAERLLGIDTHPMPRAWREQYR